jgi:hypothetical protein
MAGIKKQGISKTYPNKIIWDFGRKMENLDTALNTNFE